MSLKYAHDSRNRGRVVTRLSRSNTANTRFRGARAGPRRSPRFRSRNARTPTTRPERLERTRAAAASSYLVSRRRSTAVRASSCVVGHGGGANGADAPECIYRPVPGHARPRDKKPPAPPTPPTPPPERCWSLRFAATAAGARFSPNEDLAVSADSNRRWIAIASYRARRPRATRTDVAFFPLRSCAT